MIIDTSALISLIREEPESARFVPLMARSTSSLKMSTANYLEAGIVVDANDSRLLSERLEAVLEYWPVELVPVSPHQARLARKAYREYGKGRHPARLNFGDCFAYALAMSVDEPLLFKGDDFTRTDVKVASHPPRLGPFPV